MGVEHSHRRAVPRALFPLFAGTVVTRAGTFVVPYLTLYLSQVRELSLRETGGVIAAGGVGALLGNLAGGWCTDRMGPKRTLLASLLVNAGCMGVLGTGLEARGSYALALAGASLGAGMYTPAASTWIAAVTRGDQRRRAYTLHYICVNVGMGVGPLLGGLLATVSYAWLFAGDVVTTLVCAAVLVLATVPRTYDRGAGASKGSVSLPVGVLAFCCGSFFMIAPLMGLEYVVPLYVGTVLETSVGWVGAVYSLNAVCILGLGLPLERLLGGRSPLAMMAVAGVCWSAGLSLLAADHSVLLLLGSTVVWTLGEMIGSVVVPTFVAEHVDASVRGRALAIPDAMRSVAAIVAPVALGATWDAWGVDAVMSVLIGMPALGAGLYAAAWWRRHH